MPDTVAVVEESEGRGAWKSRGHATGSLYYRYAPPAPIDGSNADDTLDEVWVDRVRRGIRAIQELLNEHGYPTDVTGRFRKDTHDQVVAFQQANDLNAEGFVGSVTMETLMRPVLISTAAAVKVHPRWLHGFMSSESAYDPGAQGEDNPPDSGLAQFNVSTGAVTLDQAYDPFTATRLLAKRWKAALVKYEHENRRLTLDCAIAQHRSPAAADDWFRTGTGTGSIIDYVATVRGFAVEW